jgi:hypothetical protein
VNKSKQDCTQLTPLIEVIMTAITDQCSVCLDPMLDRNPVHTNCKHYFCLDCVQTALKANSNHPCPICRTRVTDLTDVKGATIKVPVSAQTEMTDSLKGDLTFILRTDVYEEFDTERLGAQLGRFNAGRSRAISEHNSAEQKESVFSRMMKVMAVVSAVFMLIFHAIRDACYMTKIEKQ